MALIVLWVPKLKKEKLLCIPDGLGAKEDPEFNQRIGAMEGTILETLFFTFKLSA